MRTMYVLTRGIRIATLTLMVAGSAVLTSCAPEIHQQVVTTDNHSTIENDIENSTSMSDAEKSAFVRALQRSDYRPYGKTVGRIISDEQKLEVAERAAAAQKASRLAILKHEIDNDIKIYPQAISVQKGHYGTGDYVMDAPHEDTDTFTFLVENTGSKFVRDFQAATTLTNKGGDTLFSGTLEDAGGIPPHGSKEISVTVHASDFLSLPNPQMVRATAIGDALANSIVNQIDYVDGTSVNRSDLESM